jgi:hypothetical protein
VDPDDVQNLTEVGDKILTHNLQNMSEIASKILLIFYIFFFTNVSSPTGHLQVEYNINCPSKLSILQRIYCFVLSAFRITLKLIYSFVI